MLRSLWGGVSGMKAHQVGLDVTSNNIANVNTTGFKASRANFSDMLYQTAQGATLPYGGRGGTNAYSVGLGAEINNTTRMHTQGSLKQSGFKGDLALDGTGMFILSADGGSTRAYSRDGRFGFDALGNLVNNAGFVVQGWIKDITVMGKTAAINENSVDTSGPITSIRIDPKMVMPAKATVAASISANLTSGYKTDQLNFAFALDSSSKTSSSINQLKYDSTGERVQVGEDLGTLFTADGNAMRLQNEQGIWMSYRDAEVTGGLNLTDSMALMNLAKFREPQSMTLNGVKITVVPPEKGPNETNSQYRSRVQDEVVKQINRETDRTGVRAYAKNSTGIRLVNDNSIAGDSKTKNITISNIEPPFDSAAKAGPGNTGGTNSAHVSLFAMFGGNPAAFKIGDSKISILGQGVKIDSKEGTITRETAFRYKYTNQSNLEVTSANGRVFNTTEDLRRWIQYDANMMKNSHASDPAYMNDSKITGIAGNDRDPIKPGFTVRISNYDILPGDKLDDGTLSPWNYSAAGASLGHGPIGSKDYHPAANSAWSRLNSVSVTMNKYGQFEITNKYDGLRDNDETNKGAVKGVLPIGNTNNLKITIANYQSVDTPSNVLFGKMMNSLQTGSLVEGGQSTASNNFKMPKLATSFDIFDSLGNRHLMQIEFRKKNGMEWTFKISLPEPAEIMGADPKKPNVLEGGLVTFNKIGGMQSVQPGRFSFTPNNGAAGPQQISLEFGQNGNSEFAGMTATAEESIAKNQKQDGYASGTLKDWYFDVNGILLGKFTNGRDLALAQVALATFDNESGLDSVGGNLFMESPNSGQGVVGQANRGGNAAVKAGKYEMSTADLSEELTQLIVIQRGYQANAKTVTTSDQVLNTLLGLKQ